LGRGPTVESPWSSSMPPSLRRGQVAPPPPKLDEKYVRLSYSLPLPLGIWIAPSNLVRYHRDLQLFWEIFDLKIFMSFPKSVTE